MSTPAAPDPQPPTITETLRRSAERAYDNWIRDEEGSGPAFTASVGARDGFVAGFLAACKEWGPFG